jgi:anthranilate phosphoribosyltransferase
MKGIIEALLSRKTLSEEQALQAMNDMISDEKSPEQISALLTALEFSGPQAEVLTGFARALRQHARSVEMSSEMSSRAIDVCGTGGDGLGTFNISTAVSFVVASAGVPCAKHGNRAVSSRSGSFDVLDALAVGSVAEPAQVEASLRGHNLAFLFAPSFHPAFAKLALLRKKLAFRTVLNALGPMLNPAGVERQLIGVYSTSLLLPMAEALQRLGSKEAMLVHGDDGSDELSLCGTTQIVHLKNKKLTHFSVTPEEFGLKKAHARELAGGSAAENARMIVDIFSGQKGAPRDAVIFNAGAALLIAGVVESFPRGIEACSRAIDSGLTLKVLNQMRTIKSDESAVSTSPARRVNG